MTAAFSGPSAELGRELYTGAAACLADVNARGGVQGRPVELIARDDGYNPAPAIHNTIDFMADPTVVALFGYVGTPTVTRVLPLLRMGGVQRDAHAQQPPRLFFPFTGAEPHRQAPYAPYVFNLRVSYRHETERIVHNLLATGRTRIAIFYQNDAYGRSGWDGVRRALQGTDGQLVAEATYRRGADSTASMRVQADLLLAESPDAIVSVGSYAACAAFVRDLRVREPHYASSSSGFSQVAGPLPIAHLSFTGASSLLSLLPPSTPRERLIFAQAVPFLRADLPLVRDYQRCRREWGHVVRGPWLKEAAPQSSAVGLEGFLYARTMVEILSRTQRPTREGVAKAAQTLHDFDPGMGEVISFSPGDHQGLTRVWFAATAPARNANALIPLDNWRAYLGGGGT